MVDQQVPAVEGGEDVDVAQHWLTHECGWRGRLEGRVLQVGPIERDEAPRIDQAQRASEAMDVRAGQLQLPHQEVDEVTRHPAVDLEPDGRAEPPAAELRLQSPEQVLGVVVVELEIAGPGHAERVVGQELHPGEQELQVGGDHVLEGHERRLFPGRHEPRQQRRDLDAREPRAAVRRVAQPYRQVQGQVRDVREWVARVDRQRGEHREDALDEVGVQRRARLVGQLVPSVHLDAGPCQPRLEVSREDLAVPFGHGCRPLRDELELGRRVEPVGGSQRRGGRVLAAQGRHAHLVELVQVAGIDGDELQPLEQRKRLVLGNGEHPLVEVEPGELAVEEAVAEDQRVVRDCVCVRCHRITDLTPITAGMDRAVASSPASRGARGQDLFSASSRNARTSLRSSTSLVTGFPTPWPASVSIRMTMGPSPPWAAWRAAANLNE